MASATGNGWAQLRQQARTLETQVKLTLRRQLYSETNDATDGDTFSHILAIRTSLEYTRKANSRATSYRVTNRRAIPEARSTHCPANPSPRFRIRHVQISPQAIQPRPTPRSPSDVSTRICSAKVNPGQRTQPCKPSLQRTLRHRRLPRLVRKCGSGIHVDGARSD